MGVTWQPVDPRMLRLAPCTRAHVSAVAYVCAGLVVGVALGIIIGYLLAHWGL